MAIEKLYFVCDFNLFFSRFAVNKYIECPLSTENFGALKDRTDS